MRRLATLAGLAFLGAGGVSAQVAPTFEAGVETVYVDAFVSHGGRSLPALTARNFELEDNGVRQEVSVVGLEEVPLRAVLVFDTSSSVTAEELEHLRAAARVFLSGLQPEDEASLLAFSHELRLHTAPTGDPRPLAGALDELRPSGGTALFDALFAALELVEQGGGRPAVVVFTDGEDRLSWLGAAEVLQRAGESNALVYSVAVGEERRLTVGPAGPLSFATPQKEKGQRHELLEELASVTGGRVRELESSDGLEEAFQEIFDELQTRYLLRYSPRGVDEEGWHELEVRLKGRKGKVRARRGYYR